MLAVYTANKPGVNLTKAYAHALRCCTECTPVVCETEGGFALKTGWCREIATGDYKDILANLPPGTVNIYGIRKHGGGGVPYQPRSPGRINQPTAYTNNLLQSFFQVMVEVISCVLDDHGMSQCRIESWLRRWGGVGFDKSFLVSGVPVGPSVKCLLNSDPNDIPELDTSTPGRFWATDDMHGTITGIPSKWIESVPIMSYLLYLPRIWGAFYSSPRVLPKLSQISRRKMTCSPVLRSVIGSTGGYSSTAGYHAQLWAYTAYRMMLPLWCTPYGKEYFWTFTYLLMKAALGQMIKHDEKITNLVPRLYTSEIGSGFASWLAWYKSREEAPKWLRTMLSELATSGPSSLVRFGKVVSYL